MAAGKSTVARLLAERFERGVQLEGDFFRRCIVSGRRELTPEPPPDAVAQLRLRYRLAAAAADTYARESFDVVLEDVVAGPLLTECVESIHSRPLHVVVLLPSVETLAEREAVRGDGAYARWSHTQLHAVFAAETPRLGLWLDTSRQTPDETVTEILARASEAAVETRPALRASPELWVRSVVESVAFYRDALGATLEHAHEDGSYAQMTLGELTLGLVERTFAQQHLPVSFRPHDPLRPPAAFELYVEAPDVDAAVARAVGAGATLLAPAAEKPWRQRVAYLRDPDGVVIELASPQP